LTQWVNPPDYREGEGLSSPWRIWSSGSDLGGGTKSSEKEKATLRSGLFLFHRTTAERGGYPADNGCHTILG